MIKKALVAVIKFYRNYMSQFKIQCCRFHPSCSEYACQAVEKHGAAKGLVKSLWRVLRCSPLSRGGYDPV